MDALFSESTPHLGEYELTEKMVDQFVNKRKFAHESDVPVWKPSLPDAKKLFNSFDRMPGGEPFTETVAPHRIPFRKYPRPATAPAPSQKMLYDAIKKSKTTDSEKTLDPSKSQKTLKHDSSTMALLSKRVGAEKNSAAGPSGGAGRRSKSVGKETEERGSKRPLPTKPMYTSKPNGLFLEYAYIEQPHGSERQEEKRIRPKSSELSRRPFAVHSAENDGAIDPIGEIMMYRNIPLKGRPKSSPQKYFTRLDPPTSKRNKGLAPWKSGTPATAVVAATGSVGDKGAGKRLKSGPRSTESLTKMLNGPSGRAPLSSTAPGTNSSSNNLRATRMTRDVKQSPWRPANHRHKSYPIKKIEIGWDALV